jgi:hypothetical protein
MDKSTALASRPRRTGDLRRPKRFSTLHPGFSQFIFTRFVLRGVLVIPERVFRRGVGFGFFL